MYTNSVKLQQGLARTLLWLCKNPCLALHDPQFALHACMCVVRTANFFNMNVMGVTGWEGVMRVRCSKGLSISQFHGHFFVRSIDLLSLPQVPASCLPLAAPVYHLLLMLTARCSPKPPNSWQKTADSQLLL